jgi:hypothetical protein
MVRFLAVAAIVLLVFVCIILAARYVGSTQRRVSAGSRRSST